MNDTPKFKICLTMAGAVSAGAYTAGVMDYLLETLELWEKAKEKNKRIGKDHQEYDWSIPMHEVEIDVISGSSAGGITGSLTLLNLIDKEYQPVNQNNPLGNNNRFYQSWVEMGDDNKTNTFEKMLAIDDLKQLKKGEKPKALLNSDPIDRIATRALQLEKFKSYPSYVSNSLDLILTTTNLRGINFKIDFAGNDNSGSIITNHASFFRYKLANKRFKEGIPEGEDLYYVLDLNRTRDMNYLKEATLSTAAFPLGLKSREVVVSPEYIRRYPKYLFGQTTGIRPLITDDSIYRFNSIDGGLINNEPFAIALKVFKEKHPIQLVKNQYAVIMIDPLPNKDHQMEEENPVADIITVAKGMYKSLRNQVMFNRDSILDAIAVHNSTKFLIEPVRKELIDGKLIRAENDLATAPFSGFAGFIDKSFRQHDYSLGRLNCQAFLRYYFGISENNIVEKLGTHPEQKAFDRFYYYEQKLDTNSFKFFPIIPDLRVLKARTNEVDTENFGIDACLNYPDYPSITEEFFYKKYKKPIRKRIKLLSNTLLSNFWFSIANTLFIKNRIAKEIENAFLRELKSTKLIK